MKLWFSRASNNLPRVGQSGDPCLELQRNCCCSCRCYHCWLPVVGDNGAGCCSPLRRGAPRLRLPWPRVPRRIAPRNGTPGRARQRSVSHRRSKCNQTWSIILSSGLFACYSLIRFRFSYRRPKGIVQWSVMRCLCYFYFSSALRLSCQNGSSIYNIYACRGSCRAERDAAVIEISARLSVNSFDFFLYFIAMFTWHETPVL